MESRTRLDPIRICLVGLSPGVARSLVRCIDGDGGNARIDAVPDLARAEMLLPPSRAHLAIIEWAALGDSAAAGIRLLRAAQPGLRVACVAGEDTPYREAAASAGADFFIVRHQLCDQLSSVLDQVALQLMGTS